MKTWKYDGLRYRRRPARSVAIGDVVIGSDHPIRVQSMTTPSTKDTLATTDQIARLVEAGCEIVRVTVPTTGDADNLPNIRRELARRGIKVPLVADIHFTPAAARRAIEHVEKIRINPGNYADKKKFAVREYSDLEYEAELDRIRGVFTPLVRRAKELGVAMRIGTNHGSLSDRIMNRYGDTPMGMVESALEFVRICEDEGYQSLVLSMKSSNPVVVLQVYRLLAERMAAEQMDYPFHLGVTEAGDGEDGRIKSALGIGALLDEGIGDTVRVSLTEDPVAEIPVAKRLVAQYNAQSESRPELPVELRESRDPFSYTRRITEPLRIGPHVIGGSNTVRVEVPLQSSVNDRDGLRRELDAEAGVRVPEETRAELISVDPEGPADVDSVAALRQSLQLVAPQVALSARVELAWLGDQAWFGAAHRLHVAVDGPLTDDDRTALTAALAMAQSAGTTLLVEAGSREGRMEVAVETAVEAARIEPGPLMLTLRPDRRHSTLFAMRLLASTLDGEGLRRPLLLTDRPDERQADRLLAPATMLGGLLCDGIGDAIQVAAATPTESRRLGFNILQAARVRITKTEFISCPSCGRTLFDLEETTARIKSRTEHLKGVKIAVMGCIVNGPGEMADADFGYVGWGEDKIALFVGKDMVAKDIPTDTADGRLVELIKEHGRWVDPPVPV